MSVKKVKPYSDEELRIWLFDDLMASIEPDLVSTQRPRTVWVLRALSPEGLKEKLDSYEQAIAEFVEQWPAFMEQKIEELEGWAEDVRVSLGTMDTKRIQDIEEQLSSLGDQ